jgi:hypothetical protein
MPMAVSLALRMGIPCALTVGASKLADDTAAQTPPTATSSILFISANPR